MTIGGDLRTHGEHSAVDDDPLPASSDSQPHPPRGGLGSHRSNPPRSGAAQQIDVIPCRGLFQVRKANPSRGPVQHRRFANAEEAAGRLIATGQGDSFEILQVVACVTRRPGEAA